MIARDSLLLSESLYGLLIALSLLCALRLRERVSARRAIELGVVIALAALTRSEALLLVLLLALPIALRLERGRRLRTFGLVCAAVVVVAQTWLGRRRQLV